MTKKDAKTQTQAKIEGPATAPELSDDLLKQLAEHTKHDIAPKKSASKPEESTDIPANGPAEATTDDTEDPLLDNLQTDEAVDDIAKEEGDEVLAAEDAAREAAEAPKPEKKGFWHKIGHFFAAWWHNKIARTITIIVVLLAIGVTTAIPTSRYFVLNTVGVRSSSSVTVMDNGTRLPLKNVTVSIGSQQVKTDSKGIAKLQNIRLGEQQLTIKRIAFATVTQQVTIGWGSNPLGEFILRPTGVRYVINVKDYVSGKGIAGAEATSGDEVAAVADKNGAITLTFDTADSPTIDVNVTAKDYRSEAATLKTDSTTPTDITLVPSRKAMFVSKQSGKFDLISMYLDGKDRKVVLAGTGSENNNVSLVSSPDGQSAALVSTRDDIRDSDGYRLSTLTIVPNEDAAPITVTHAEQIQLIDWTGTRLVYVEASAGASAANPQRYRLMSFDYEANKRVTLATANQFNGIVSMKGQIYYAVSSTDPGIHAQFYRIKPDGSARQVVFSQEVWTVLRSGYDTVQLQTPGGWYSYKVDGTPQQSTAPAVYASRGYVDGTGSTSLWVDTRDGQGTLIALSTDSGKETVLHAQNGLTYPVRWLNDNTIIYRISTGQEVADYAISVSGGEAKKVADVSTTYGFTY